jgi:hypothetical protein
MKMKNVLTFTLAEKLIQWLPKGIDLVEVKIMSAFQAALLTI